MEKELTELFEKAKKAAEVSESSPGEEGRCLDALERLKKFPVNYKVLVSTQFVFPGWKTHPSAAKHKSDKIKGLASEVVEIWKAIVVQETKNKNGTPNGVKTEPAATEEKNLKRTNSIKVEQKSSAKIVKVEKTTHSITPISPKSSIKPEFQKSSIKSEFQKSSIKSESQKSSIESEYQKSIKVETVEVSETTSKENYHVEKKFKVDKSTFDPPKLTSLVSCKDPVRDKIREQLAETFCKVSSEVGDDLRERVKSCDLNRVAVLVETAMFEKYGKPNGAQKHKYRSIMFNIRDSKNPDFRRKVLLGEFEPRQVPELTPDQMASDARQQENQTIKQKAMYNSERAAAPKASTDQFTCTRCKKKECAYYQMQTRSADEPMTTFVMCVNCDKHWKFC